MYMYIYTMPCDYDVISVCMYIGYNGTIFAYGQTGCGKSYTMVGVEDPASQVGVIPRAFDHIFDAISVTEGVKFLVQASYLEIYNEEVRDLLGKEKDVKKKLDLKEHPERGVYVSGLSHHRVHNRKDLEKVMAIGSKNRSMGATLMNVDSSRSHCIFTIDIEMMVTEDDDEKVRSGRLNLVDLAGSERQSKTGATGQRLKEATKNQPLSVSARQCHICSGGRQIEAHPVSRLKTHSSPTVLPGGQHKDSHGILYKSRR